MSHPSRYILSATDSACGHCPTSQACPLAATPLDCSAPSDIALLPLSSLKILRFCQFFQQIIAISLQHCGPSSSCLEVQTVCALLSEVIPFPLMADRPVFSRGKRGQIPFCRISGAILAARPSVFSQQALVVWSALFL